MGGDLYPMWFKYGPLYSYILAAIYWVQHLFFDGTLQAFVESYFFESTSFYYTARFVNGLLHLSLAGLTFYIAKRWVSIHIAFFATMLAILPFMDNLTGYSIRVDSLLALSHVGALLCGLEFLRSKNPRWYMAAGLLTGFALGTKPLPALMILPSLYLAWILGWSAKPWQKSSKRVTKAPTVWSLILQSFVQPRLYAIVAFAIIGLFISNPYALLELDTFIQEQLQVIRDDSGFNFTKGYVLSRFASAWGWPFIIACVGSVGYALWSGVKYRAFYRLVMASYILVYWGAFATAPARNYFYVPLVPILCVLIAIMTAELLHKSLKERPAVKPIAMVGLFAVLAFQPGRTLTQQYLQYRFDANTFQQTSSIAAESWVKQQIDPGTQLGYYGYYVNLPRLIDSNPNEQAVYGEYFMYNRGQSEYLKERFSAFMQQYITEGFPVYDLVYSAQFSLGEESKSYYLRYEMGDSEQYLFPYMNQLGVPYVITHYDLQKYPEFAKRLVWSSLGKNLRGTPV
ncbi:MAG: glycosyltransferase family 39 protein, partial [Balneolaceae bacterium]|nr:glycosyltransferase family 39 protein [Balneolaceae bacterium]